MGTALLPCGLSGSIWTPCYIGRGAAPLGSFAKQRSVFSLLRSQHPQGICAAHICATSTRLPHTTLRCIRAETPSFGFPECWRPERRQDVQVPVTSKASGQLSTKESSKARQAPHFHLLVLLGLEVTVVEPLTNKTVFGNSAQQINQESTYTFPPSHKISN